MSEPKETPVEEQVAEVAEDNFDDLAPGNVDLAKFIEESPVINKETPPEAKEKEPEEPGEAETEESKEDELIESKKYKIRDVEFAEDELVEALEDRKNRTAWQKNLTQKSQIAASLAEDQIKLLIPYALRQRELPKDLEKVFEAPELPKSFKYETEDGDEMEIAVNKLPPEMLKALGQQMFLTMYPDLDQQRQEVEKRAGEVAEKMKQIVSYQELDATDKALRFMQEHPDYAITIRKGESLKENLGSILNSGGLHPELAKANKFLMLLRHIQEHGGTLEEAYAFHEGNQIKQKKVKEQIKKNQESDIPPEKGGKKVTKSKDDEFLDTFRDPGLQRLHDLDL